MQNLLVRRLSQTSWFSLMSRSITVVGSGMVGGIGGRSRTICSQVVIGQLSGIGYTCRSNHHPPIGLGGVLPAPVVARRSKDDQIRWPT